MKKIIVILLIIVATIAATIGGVYCYLMNGDEIKITNFFEYDLPNLREYGTNDLVKIQEVEEERMNEEFTNGDYTQSEPYIVYNPYGRSTLSAYVQIPTENAVKYEYTVQGKTDEVDFTYSYDEYQQNPIIPVAALYYDQDNTVNITLIDEDDSKTELEYTLTVTEEIAESNADGAEIEIKDQDAFDTVIAGNYFFDGSGNAYDQNGDLRFTALSHYRTTIQKAINGKYYIGYPDENYLSDEYFSENFFEINFMGRINPDSVLSAPDGYGFHHDLAYDETTNTIYGLASTEKGDEAFSDEEYGESLIVYIDADTYKVTDYFSVTDLIDDSIKVGAGTVAYDIHLNSVDVLEERNELMIHSRSGSMTFGLDIDTQEINWVLGNPEHFPEDLQEIAIEPIGDDMTFENGGHSVFEVKDVPEYEEYYADGKMVISMLDNNKIETDDAGNIQYSELNLEEENTTQEPPGTIPLEGQEQDEIKSRVLTYAVDFENNTFELINAYDTIGYSAYTSNTYVTPDKEHQVYYLGAGTMGITDLEGNSQVEITDLRGGYRGVVYTPEQIKSSMVFE